MNIRKVDSKSVILHKGSKVTLKTCGNSREVLLTAGNNTKCPIQNLSKDKYLDKETGEIKERVHQENRNQSPKSARKSIHRLSDLEYSDDTDSSNRKIVEKMVDGVSKKFIKGERLKFYPTGMPLFSASRGMNRPVMEKMSNGEAMERVSDCRMVYRETYAIGDGKGGNLVDKRYYKKKIADHLKKPD